MGTYEFLQGCTPFDTFYRNSTEENVPCRDLNFCIRSKDIDIIELIAF